MMMRLQLSSTFSGDLMGEKLEKWGLPSTNARYTIGGRYMRYAMVWGLDGSARENEAFESENASTG